MSFLPSGIKKYPPMQLTFVAIGWTGITQRNGLLMQGQTMHHQVFNTLIILFFFTYLFTGSGSAEGFHDRLNHNMPRNAMSLDKMVDYLAAEDEYWKRVVNDPRSWSAKKTSHSSSQERHRRKRQMLKHYVERGGDSERSDVVDQFISSDILSSDGDTERAEDDLDDDNSSTQPSSTTTTTTTTTTSSEKPRKKRRPRKPNPNTPMHERCLKCRLYAFNNDCSLTMCKACCADSPAACKYTGHKRAKLGARQPLAHPRLNQSHCCL